MIQFTAFMDIVNYLRSDSDDEIKIAARELIYTPLDIDFLTKLNDLSRKLRIMHFDKYGMSYLQSKSISATEMHLVL